MLKLSRKVLDLHLLLSLPLLEVLEFVVLGGFESLLLLLGFLVFCSLLVHDLLLLLGRSASCDFFLNFDDLLLHLGVLFLQLFQFVFLVFPRFVVPFQLVRQRRYFLLPHPQVFREGLELYLLILAVYGLFDGVALG